MVRLYLDQCHWSDMARAWAEPAVVRKLHAMATRGEVQHVLSIAHIVETLQCKQKRVKRLLINCLDSATTPIWIKAADIIIQEEITNYLHEFVGLGKGVHIDPFRPGLFASVGTRMPASLAATRRRPSVKKLIRFIESASARTRRRLLAIGETDTAPIRALFHSRSGPAGLNMLNGFVDLYVPPELRSGMRVGARLRQAFLAQFDLARCPSLMNLIWIVHHMSRAGLRPEPGDIMDLYHAIPAYTYCDVFVTDKRIADFIRRLRNPQGRFAATFRSLPHAVRFIEGLI